ncbi:hypothetical protein NQ315_011350 [Exocentrus adspersus]|uniref:CCHC-type domain-containing protein n=1 Tax=Exocentrus adspersus TaxID=1586481 RepID=A0AAV8VK96_9CUCU|nr:hypothetical protein NQ315_011350 [Exocentrus adspersus]
MAEVWYKSLRTVKFTWNEWKQQLESNFPSKRDYYSDLLVMIDRKKLQNESYTTYYFHKLALLNCCKISGPEAVSCIIGGINDNVVKTGATAGNHQTPESLYGYLTSLNPQPGTSRLGDHAFKHFQRSNKQLYGGHKNMTQAKKTLTCFVCHKDGHVSKFCPEKDSKKGTKTSSQLRCDFCHRVGHLEENSFTKKRAVGAKPSQNKL